MYSVVEIEIKNSIFPMFPVAVSRYFSLEQKAGSVYLSYLFQIYKRRPSVYFH